MTNLRILMMSGYAQSGKDFVGEFLVKNHNFTRYAFADSLKDEASELYDIPRDKFDCQLGKTQLKTVDGKEVTLRRILISHGTLRRSEDPNYWVRKTASQIIRCGKNNIVITDWRYKNEYLYIRSIFPNATITTIRLNRWSKSAVDDLSETSLDDFRFDTVISNTGTKSDLVKTLNNLFVQ